MQTFLNISCTIFFPFICLLFYWVHSKTFNCKVTSNLFWLRKQNNHPPQSFNALFSVHSPKCFKHGFFIFYFCHGLQSNLKHKKSIVIKDVLFNCRLLEYFAIWPYRYWKLYSGKFCFFNCYFSQIFPFCKILKNQKYGKPWRKTNI